jgi:hypothetical protein
MEVLSEITGMDAEQLKFAIGLLGVFPLSLMHRNIINSEIRLWSSLVVGVLFSLLLFGTEAIHFLITTMTSLLCVRFLPHSVSPYVVLIFNLSYLGYGYVPNQNCRKF